MFLKAVLFFVLIFSPILAHAKDDPVSLTAKANKLYKEGKYDEALSLYDRALKVDPESAVLNFNIGAAYYKKGDYEKAAESFAKASLAEDKSLEFKASYNSGNSRYQSARLKEDTDLEGAVNRMRQAVEQYKRAMELNNKDEDAKINHSIAEKELKALLEKLKKQPPDKQSGQNKGQCPNPQQSESKGSEKEGSEQKKAQGSAAEEQKEDSSEGKSSGEKEEAQKADEKKQDGSGEEKQDGREMSEQEARMLLEGQRKDEVLGGQIRDAEKGRWEKVEKDW